MATTPEFLYHGSLFKQAELMPGFKRTNKITRWDKTESNIFLYASSVENTAIELGFASAIEKLFAVSHFHSQNGKIEIETNDTVTRDELTNVVVYLYKIRFNPKEGWLKNDNKHNGLTTEYKTPLDVYDIVSCEQVDIAKWLKNFQVFIRKENQVQSVALEALEPAVGYSW